MASMGAAGWLSLAGGLVSLMGARDAARAARTAGERSQLAAEFNAMEMERQAGISVALGQRQAMEERRQGDIAASRALAVAAASGAGVSDPTIVRLLTAHKGEGAYRAEVALYEGEERARSLRIAAISERLGGSQALEEGLDRARAYNIQGLSTIVRTGSSLYSKYGVGGPNSKPAGSGDAALIYDSADVSEIP